jgi:hypothetical protein
MAERDNLFRPIHKGIRSKIYELGLRLGTTDFRNPAESNKLVQQLKQDLTLSTSNCIFCLIFAHKKHEEKDLFSAVQPYDKGIVDEMMREHRVVQRRVQVVARTCDELQAISDPERRAEVGDRLHREVTDFFVFYLLHMNNEESLMVPVLWDHYTDEQLRAFRMQFYNSIPLPRFEEWMRWTLPALNPDEQLALLRGLKTDPPPNRFAVALQVAKDTLSPDRWSLVEALVGR